MSIHARKILFFHGDEVLGGRWWDIEEVDAGDAEKVDGESSYYVIIIMAM